MGWFKHREVPSQEVSSGVNKEDPFEKMERAHTAADTSFTEIKNGQQFMVPENMKGSQSYWERMAENLNGDGYIDASLAATEYANTLIKARQNRDMISPDLLQATIDTINDSLTSDEMSEAA